MCRLRSERSCREMALRAAGRFKDKIRIEPACAVGTSMALMKDDDDLRVVIIELQQA